VGYTPVACGRPDRSLVDGVGKPVAPVHLLDFEGELVMGSVAHRIARDVGIMTDAKEPWRFDGRPLRLDDVFVLTRATRDARAIGEVLAAHGVPHAFYKEDGLFQGPEAADLSAVLHAVRDPGDRSRSLSACLTPFFGLPLSSMARARDLTASHPVVARLHAWNAIAETRDFARLFHALLHDSGVVRREIFSSSERTAMGERWATWSPSSTPCAAPCARRPTSTETSNALLPTAPPCR
jgi:hypothetical protein